MNKQFLRFTLFLLMYLTLPLTATAQVVDIPDSNLRAEIEKALGKAPGTTITATEMATLTRLEAKNANISDLTGLEGATNLKSLRLGGNSISGIAPVTGLTNLKVLSLWTNSISDISPVEALTNLTELNLSGNLISDISPVADLNQLTWLHLQSNRISDIAALAGLTNLTALRLDRNSISDISALSGLTHPIELRLERNNISDISPLAANAGLGEGDTIYVRGNPLSYLSIHTHLPTLQSRGVTVAFDNRTPTTLQKTLSVITELDSLLIVEVRDSNGLAFEGVPVTFTVTSGGGTLSATHITTDENGRAENRFTLGPDGGTSTVRASVEGISEPAIFTPSVNTNGMVRLVYFLPNDRPARPDRVTALRQLIKDANQFFADEMHGHGFGRKTFTVETDADGEPLIHQVNGKFTEEYYYNSSTDFKIWQELLEHFDNFQHVYFIAIDLSHETLSGGKSCGIGAVSFRSSNRGLWLGSRDETEGEQAVGGIATIPASGDCFRLRTTAHELGHAFGLGHDFREGIHGNYVMAYGTATRLSECAAEWLSVSRFFNTKPVSLNAPGKIQFPSIRTYSPEQISLRFEVTDPDGLHHAQLVLPEGSLGPILFNCQQLNGKTSTVEFAISTAELVHRITLEVIDAGRITLQIIDLEGNITWARFPIQLDDILSDQKLTTLEKISGDNQYGLTFTPLPSPLVVKVTDQNGFAFFEEVSVTFTVTAGDGTLSVTRAKTDKNGRAESTLTLGPNLGTNTVSVSVAGIEPTVTFNSVARAAVDIPDSNLRTAIETTLGLALSNPIALSEMAALPRLEAPNANISDLTGLEFATNLTELSLGPKRVGNEWRNSNAVSDLSPLAGLTRLTLLHLPNNSISDLSPLANLTKLTKLRLGGNSISDISAVAGLTQLESLSLWANSISNSSPVEALTNLTELNLSGNSISSIVSVAGLTQMTWLHLQSNRISDISALAGLTNLTALRLDRNSISDISALSSLTHLTELRLDRNSITDLSPLVANAGLGSGDEVDVRGNPLSYLSIHTHIPALQSRGVTVEFDNQAPPALLKISGDNQNGASFASLSQPLVVEAQDANGSALVGISVRFAVTTGGGTLSTTITRTDENGRAQSTLTLGPNLGTNTVEVSAAGIESPVTFYAISDTESPPIIADVNNDGSVNILDLILIASKLGNTGTNLVVDVNGDGTVSILDLVLAAGMFDGAAAAPSVQPQVPETLTAVEVQGWLTDARALEVRDSIVKRGFLVLEQLLVSLTPRETELLANYPNPFNPETWIPYRLAEDAFVTLTIYDTVGHVVRTLDVGHRIASAYESRSKTVHWDGRNNLGEQVASGVYFYTLIAGNFSATRKMLILK